MNRVEKALDIAMEIHNGQKDLGGEPYIFHPIRVYEAVKSRGRTAQILALLHDVMEDVTGGDKGRDMLKAAIRATFGEEITRDLKSLTRLKGEKYEDYIKGLVLHASHEAIAVKIADLNDNMDMSRLPPQGRSGAAEAISRRRKYARAKEMLIQLSGRKRIRPTRDS